MKNQLIALSLLFAALALSPSAPAQGTAFTYQGHLTDNGGTAGGSYNLRFGFHATELGGSPIAVLTNANVAVTNGLFTVALDFGAAAFAGPARWLEIGVRTNGSSGEFTTLTPRQPVTPTPYAIFAGKAAMLAENASQTFTGTIGFNPSTPGAPPFAVGSTGKVNNLNADLFDGLDSTNFLLKSEHCLTNIAELQARAAGFVPCVTVLGYYAPGDGGGGAFYWDASATEPENGGTVISPGAAPPTGRWKRLYSSAVNVKWFGAKGDAYGTNGGVGTDDTTAISNAIAVASPISSTMGTVYLPGAPYRVTSTLNLSGGIRLAGDANGGFGINSVIKYEGTGNCIEIRSTPSNAGGNELRDLMIARALGSGGDAIYVQAWLDTNVSPNLLRRPVDVLFHNITVTTWNPDLGPYRFARALHIDGSMADVDQSRGVRRIFVNKFRGIYCSMPDETIYLAQATHFIGSFVECSQGSSGIAAGLKIDKGTAATAGSESANIQIIGLYVDTLTLGDKCRLVKLIGHVETSITVAATCIAIDLLLSCNGTLTVSDGATGSAQGTYRAIINANPSKFHIVPSYRGTGTNNFGNVLAGAVVEGTITLIGANPGDPIVPIWPAGLPAGITGVMFVSATDTVTVRIVNNTAAAINLGTLGVTTWGAVAMR